MINRAVRERTSSLERRRSAQRVRSDAAEARSRHSKSHPHRATAKAAHRVAAGQNRRERRRDHRHQGRLPSKAERTRLAGLILPKEAKKDKFRLEELLTLRDKEITQQKSTLAMRDRKIDQLEKEVTPRRLTCTVEGLSLALRQGDHEPAAGRRALVTSF